MDDREAWQERNNAFLRQALAWLRVCLERHAPAETLSAAPAQAARGSRWWNRDSSSRSNHAAAAPTPESGDAAVRDARRALEGASVGAPPPALLLLGQQLGLSSFERDVLLLCAAMELDTRIAALCARAQDNSNRPYPTFALALSLFAEPAWDVLAPHRPLRFWRLLEINQPPGQPLTASPLRADERIVNYIKGLNYLDDRIVSLLGPFDIGPDAMPLPPSHADAVAHLVRHIQTAASTGSVAPVQLLGGDPTSKQLIAAHTAAQLGLQLHRLPAAMIPAASADLETLTRLWQRESLLLPVALYIDAYESEAASGDLHASALHRFLARRSGVVFVDSRDLLRGAPADSVAIDIGKPTTAEQHAAWRMALGQGAAVDPTPLTGQFHLGLAGISSAVRTAVAQADTQQPPTLEALWQACLAQTRPRLDALAQRLVPKATWETLVLPAEETEQLRAICDQVRQRHRVYAHGGFGERMNRGLGISVLFAGESGTGKTMAAEVIANDLQLNLYRIDLSAVVSKYIGETEKNLRRLFDAAEDGGAILFFDEADALFGKRSEVKDSHDRYANIEINYLLQRMESYRGVAILATNLRSALDAAFVRRLRFIVSFAYPGAAERKLIWQKAFPAATATEGLDFERLSRLNLTGGGIANVALNAAFLAARADSPVTMPLVLNAARAELRKLERPIYESEFRYLEPAAGAK